MVKLKKRVKRLNRRDLSVVWLDLANAYGAASSDFEGLTVL